MPSLAEKEKLDPLGEEYVRLVPSPDGKRLAIGTEKSAMIWDLNAGKRLWRIRFPQTRLHDVKFNQPPEYLYPTDMAFAPDGRMLAMTFWDGTARLFNASNGRELYRLLDPEAREVHRSGLAFSPDGRFLAVGMGFENMLRLWDVTRQEPLPALRWEYRFGYNRGTNNVTFSPDGKTVAAACEDERIRLWEVATGRLRRKAYAEGLGRIAFSPDGRLLASGHFAFKRVYLWDWRNPGLSSPPPLTAAEAERYWKDLSEPDAAAAYWAMAAMAASPRQAILLMGRLRPAAQVPAADIDRLIKELDDDRLSVRERAAHQLVDLGVMAEERLRKELSQKEASEVRKRIEDILHRLELGPPPEQLRSLRAIEVLEYLGTPDAREILHKLSRGAAGRVETEDAKAALRRLARNGSKQR